jgi:hypothetical protein
VCTRFLVGRDDGGQIVIHQRCAAIAEAIVAGHT